MTDRSTSAELQKPAFDATGEDLKKEIKEQSERVHPHPTEPQKEALNYRVGHVNFQGIPIAIEVRAGGKRRGIAGDGTHWVKTLQYAYGRIKGVRGADTEFLDCFVGPHTDSDHVYIVNQVNKDRSFDEHKVLLGWGNENDARAGYLSAYDLGWQGIGSIVAMTMDEFKRWMKTSDLKFPATRSQIKSDSYILSLDESETRIFIDKPCIDTPDIDKIDDVYTDEGPENLVNNEKKLKENKINKEKVKEDPDSEFKVPQTSPVIIVDGSPFPADKDGNKKENKDIKTDELLDAGFIPVFQPHPRGRGRTGFSGNPKSALPSDEFGVAVSFVHPCNADFSHGSLKARKTGHIVPRDAVERDSIRGMDGHKVMEEIEKAAYRPQPEKPPKRDLAEDSKDSNKKSEKKETSIDHWVMINGHLTPIRRKEITNRLMSDEGRRFGLSRPAAERLEEEINSQSVTHDHQLYHILAIAKAIQHLRNPHKSDIGIPAAIQHGDVNSALAYHKKGDIKILPISRLLKESKNNKRAKAIVNVLQDSGVEFFTGTQEKAVRLAHRLSGKTDEEIDGNSSSKSDSTNLSQSLLTDEEKDFIFGDAGSGTNGNWVTINGHHVNIGADGSITGSGGPWTLGSSEHKVGSEASSQVTPKNKNPEQKPDLSSEESSRLSNIITQEHIENGIRITGFKAAQEFLDYLSKSDLHPKDLATACGAGRGSKVHFKPSEGGVLAQISHKNYKAERLVYQMNNKLYVNNVHFKKKKGSSKGQGAFMMSREASMAQQLGVKKIQTWATGRASSKVYNGYYTWPRCGYNRDLKEEELEKAKTNGFEGCTSVLDLMATREGREYWKSQDRDPDPDGNMVFDPTPGSRSMTVLNAYLSELNAKGLTDSTLLSDADYVEPDKDGWGEDTEEAESKWGPEKGDDLPEEDIDLEASDKAMDSPEVQAFFGKRESEDKLNSNQAKTDDEDIWIKIDGIRINISFNGSSNVSKNQSVQDSESDSGSSRESEEEGDCLPESDMDMEASDKALDSEAVQKVLNSPYIPVNYEESEPQDPKVDSDGTWITVNGRHINISGSGQSEGSGSSGPHLFGIKGSGGNQSQMNSPMSSIPTPSPSEQEYPDITKGIEIVGFDHAEEFLKKNGINNVHPKELAGAVGAGRGSTVKFTSDAAGLTALIDHPYYEGKRIIYNAKKLMFGDRKPMRLDNSHFKAFRDAPSGQGAAMLKRELDMADKLNIKEFVTFAAGKYRDPEYNGYYTWARCGYDRDLTNWDKKVAAEKGFKNVQRVSDLMKTQKGRDHWKVHGTSGNMFFDTRSGSRSTTILNSYLEELKSKGMADPTDS